MLINVKSDVSCEVIGDVRDPPLPMIFRISHTNIITYIIYNTDIPPGIFSPDEHLPKRIFKFLTCQDLRENITSLEIRCRGSGGGRLSILTCVVQLSLSILILFYANLLPYQFNKL